MWRTGWKSACQESHVPSDLSDFPFQTSSALSVTVLHIPCKPATRLRTLKDKPQVSTCEYNPDDFRLLSELHLLDKIIWFALVTKGHVLAATR